MARQSNEQKATVQRVMHDYKHGALNRGRGGKGKNPKQAVAVALHEAGASKYEPPEKNRQNLRQTKSNERHGETGQALAKGNRKSTKTGRSGSGAQTEADLYEKAQRHNIPGRSAMSKSELAQALQM